MRQVAKNNDRKRSPQELRKTRITETSRQNKTAGTSCQHNALARTKDQAKLHVIGVTEEAALRSASTVGDTPAAFGQSQRPLASTGRL
jgi:hypothetical protein